MTTPNDNPATDADAGGDTSADNDVVRGVTLADIAAVLEGEELEYRLEEPVVRTGFVNAAMVFTFDDGTLVFLSLIHI